jgi:hypothetical protein
MSIELDKIPLIKHTRDDDTGKTKVLNSVYNVKVDERRSVVEHKIPGMEGGILQDLGREPVRISFEGVIYGEEAKEALKNIRLKFKAGKPVPFSSDVSGVAEVTDVLIEDLQVDDMGGMPNNYKYRIVLREYIPPPQKDEPPPSQEEEAEDAVEEKADDAKASVNYIEGKVVDADDNPQADMDVKITFDGGEYTIKTDENGYYRKDNLEPGKYTVTVDAPGYEDMKEEVEVKSS